MRVKKYLPSLLTMGNLFLGFLSILYIQRASNPSTNTSFFEISCYLILCATILDSLDGKLARKIGLASDFGKEIDSLADLISFCLAPAFLIFNIYLHDWTLLNQQPFFSEAFFLYLAFISSLPVIMGAIRLARFNVTHSQEGNKAYFIGLPSPMLAITVCSIVMMKINLEHQLDKFFELNIILPIIIFLSFLMISKIRFAKFPLFTLKEDKQNSIRLILLLSIIIIIIISIFYGYGHITLFCFSSYYILTNLLIHFIIILITPIIP